jgi:lycopene beta-cyclase
MTAATAPLIIAGGGLAGGLAALALAERRPDVDFLLIEESGRFGGNHIWSFFDADVEEGRPLADRAAGRAALADHEICFPQRLRTLGFGYNSVKVGGLRRPPALAAGA